MAIPRRIKKDQSTFKKWYYLKTPDFAKKNMSGLQIR